MLSLGVFRRVLPTIPVNEYPACSGSIVYESISIYKEVKLQSSYKVNIVKERKVRKEKNQCIICMECKKSTMFKCPNKHIVCNECNVKLAG